MADWSNLQEDLILIIVDFLPSSIDVLRFRSVCSPWRSAVQSPPDLFPIITNGLFKHPIYLISDVENEHNWIVKVSKYPPNRMGLVMPLSAGKLRPPLWSELNLNFLNFRVVELGHEYVRPWIRFPYSNSPDVYGEKVVYRQVDAEFEILTIIDNGLSMFKVGDVKPKEISRSHAPYVQVKLFKGRFYALDLSGELVMVESGSRIECVANPLPGWNIKCFVESCDRLLLVEACTDNVEHDVECATNRFLWNLETGKVRFKVYKLVESEKRWELMESLGDQILFLGKNSSFSVSAANVSGCVGNCIYTCSSRFGKLDIHICGETWTQMSDVAVYHLHNDKFKLLTTESEHWKLFSPPPAWTWLSDMEGEYDSSADGYVYIS